MAMSNAVGWFDMYVDDMGRAVKFYQDVLDLKLTAMDDPTGETQMMSFPITDESMGAYGALGALVKADSVKPGPGGTVVYFASQDCSVEESRVVKAGGSVMRPKFSIGEFGWVALCQDTEGNVFGLNSPK